MTKRDAYQQGKDIAEAINYDGDFTGKELSSEDNFREAFWEIVENRKQYADDISYDLKTDAQWEAYEEGLARGLDIICKARFGGRKS